MTQRWNPLDLAKSTEALEAELQAASAKVSRYKVGTDRYARAQRRFRNLLQLLRERREAGATTHGGEQ